jgi:DNA repair photolyase
MILSVSRRTDIVAFYLDWFFNRLKEGYVLVRNPMNYHQVSKIYLSASDIDCIVFWTKDPTNILDKISMLDDYIYYFHITITGYDRKIEPNVAPKEHIIKSFQKLSQIIGSERVIWRYDPIIISRDIDVEYHRKKFEFIASQLSGYTQRCTISFVDMYKKTERNMKGLNVQNISDAQKIEIATAISEIARAYGLKVETCCEDIDLSRVGICHGKCIDDEHIARISGRRINAKKDKNQRAACGCVESVDIGVYNTCKHGCLYCYANYSNKAVNSNVKMHDPRSPMLIGNVEPDDVITERKAQRLIDSQVSFFD